MRCRGAKPVSAGGADENGVSVGFRKEAEKMKLTSEIDKHDMTDEDIKNRFVTQSERLGDKICQMT